MIWIFFAFSLTIFCVYHGLTRLKTPTNTGIGAHNYRRARRRKTQPSSSSAELEPHSTTRSRSTTTKMSSDSIKAVGVREPVRRRKRKLQTFNPGSSDNELDRRTCSDSDEAITQRKPRGFPRRRVNYSRAGAFVAAIRFHPSLPFPGIFSRRRTLRSQLPARVCLFCFVYVVLFRFVVVSPPRAVWISPHARARVAPFSYIDRLDKSRGRKRDVERPPRGYLAHGVRGALQGAERSSVGACSFIPTSPSSQSFHAPPRPQGSGLAPHLKILFVIVFFPPILHQSPRSRLARSPFVF